MDGAAQGLPSICLRTVRRAVLTGLVLVTAGCGVVYMPGSNHRSDVLQKMRADRQAPRPLVGGPPETFQSNEAQLQAAAFSLLAGKSGPEAVAFLQDDGWNCAGLACRTTTIQQELPYVIGVRLPGPPRRFTTVSQLTLPAGLISVPADILSARTSLVEDAP
jgi:hypothetical protein